MWCAHKKIMMFLRQADKAGVCVCVAMLNECVSMGCPALAL